MYEKNILKRQHKFFPTICIVIGFIVGTGIFWQPPTVYRYVDGNMWWGVLAWVVGGVAISTCVYTFSVMARKYEQVHGMVDYAEAVVGKKFGYLCGWFFTIMYQTAGYAIIAWITASFTATLAGHEHTRNTPFVFFITAFYMVITFVINYLAPKLPIRFNSATTVLCVIPLLLMGTAGVVIARFVGDGGYSQAVAPVAAGNVTRAGFMGAVFATAFAYNGWQAAVAFNSEVNDSKRKFPVALLTGFFLVMVIYVLYFIGVVSAANPASLMDPELNQEATRAAFVSLFGEWTSRAVMVFVIMSGLGILNMCCLGMSRGLYSLARRGRGPIPDRMVQLDPKTGVPVCSMITCVGVSFLWLMVIYGNYNGWFRLPGGTPFRFFLPDFYNMIFFILQIPIFIGFVARNWRDKGINWFNRLIAPFIAIGGAGFMTFALVDRSWQHAVVYLIIFAILAIGGLPFARKKA